MRQIPLSKGDFVIAHVAMEEHLARQSAHGRYEEAMLNKAVEVGAEAVRKLRGIARLPPGAKQLRADLFAAFHKRGERLRACARQHDDAYSQHPSRLDRRWRITHERVNTVYLRSGAAETYRKFVTPNEWRERRYDQISRVTLEDRRPMVITETIGLYLRVRPNFLTAVLKPKIAVVDGHLVLDARPVQDFALPPGIAAVYDVLYLASEHPEGLVVPGIVIVPTVGRPTFGHSRASRVFGAIAVAAKLPAYQEAHRGAA